MLPSRSQFLQQTHGANRCPEFFSFFPTHNTLVHLKNQTNRTQSDHLHGKGEGPKRWDPLSCSRVCSRAAPRPQGGRGLSRCVWRTPVKGWCPVRRKMRLAKLETPSITTTLVEWQVKHLQRVSASLFSILFCMLKVKPRRPGSLCKHLKNMSEAAVSLRAAICEGASKAWNLPIEDLARECCLRQLISGALKIWFYFTMIDR